MSPGSRTSGRQTALAKNGRQTVELACRSLVKRAWGRLSKNNTVRKALEGKRPPIIAVGNIRGYGLADAKANTITLSETHVETGSRAEIRDTVLHELAHIVVAILNPDRIPAHGKKWIEVCALLDIGRYAKSYVKNMGPLEPLENEARSLVLKLNGMMRRALREAEKTKNPRRKRLLMGWVQGGIASCQKVVDLL
jgi:hypothetical protein